MQQEFETATAENGPLRDLVAQVRSADARMVIFGGWPRDIVVSRMYDLEIRPADLDVVVVGIDRRRLRSLLPSDTSTNAFGGFVATVGSMKVDAWCIEDTYTLAIRGMPFDCDLLPQTTVFTVESIIFKPAEFWRTPTIVEDSFYSSVVQRSISMQRGEIRFPPFQVGRVLQQAVKLGFKMSDDVLSFIYRTLAAPDAYEEIVDGILKFGHAHLRPAAVARLDRVIAGRDH